MPGALIAQPVTDGVMRRLAGFRSTRLISRRPSKIPKRTMWSVGSAKYQVRHDPVSVRIRLLGVITVPAQVLPVAVYLTARRRGTTAVVLAQLH
jgi:hypothetical protein